MNRLRVFRRVKVLEWQVEMLLQKIASVAGDWEASGKMKKLLETMPRELKDSPKNRGYE